MTSTWVLHGCYYDKSMEMAVDPGKWVEAGRAARRMREKGLDCSEGTVGRNTDVNSHSGAVSDRNEDHIVGNWRELYPLERHLASTNRECD